MPLPRFAICAALLLAAAHSTPAAADMGRDAKLLVGMFGSVCSQAMTDPRAVRRLTKDFEAKRLPRKRVKDLFDTVGQGWSVDAPFGRLSIAIIEPPACVVVTEDVAPDAVQTGFRSYVKSLTADSGTPVIVDTNDKIGDRPVRKLQTQVTNTVMPYRISLSQQEGTSWSRLEAVPLN